MTRVPYPALALFALVVFATPALAEPPPQAAPAAAPAKTAPAAPLYAGGDVAKAVDGMTSACSAAQAQQARIEALAAERTAAQASLAKAQQALAKHRKTMVSTKARLQAEAKRGGAATDALIDSARTHYKSTLDQAKAVETEAKRLQAAEDELAKLVGVAEDAAKACETHEATLRAAASEGRKQAMSARASASKARTLAKLPTQAAREQMRVRDARLIEDLQTSTDEARAELEAMEAVALESKKAQLDDLQTKNTPSSSAKR